MPLPSSLRQEIATLEKDFLTFAGKASILINPDPTLRTRGGGLGLALYDQIEKDCHAYAVLQKRKFALVGRDWQVDPASDDAEDIRAAELVEAQLENLGVVDFPEAKEHGVLGFDGVVLSFQDAILKGNAPAEVMWAESEGEIVAAEIRPRDPRRFGWVQGEKGWELRLLTRNNQHQGEPLPPRRIIYHVFDGSDDNPYGLGLGSRLFWPVFFKRQDIKFWLIFADKFGAPTPLGKYPAGTEKEKIKVLLEALEAITQGMATTIPEGMMIEFLEATRSGSIDTYERLCRYMDEQMSECVLGETGSTNQSGSGGSRARDEVGNECRLELVKADADLLANTLNRTLIKWISQLNLPNARPPRLKWIFDEPEDLEARASRDKQLFDMGFRLTLDRVIEIYGEGYEDIRLVQPQVNLSDPLPTEGAIRESLLQQGEQAFAEREAQRPLGEAYAEQLADRAGGTVDGWVRQVKHLLEESDSLHSFSESLFDLYPQLPKDQFAELMRNGLLAAHLGGMAEVSDEVEDG